MSDGVTVITSAASRESLKRVKPGVEADGTLSSMLCMIAPRPRRHW
jgi:hypothetical protein